MLLQFILLRDICKVPEQVVYADRLLKSIVFWRWVSHFSTCQSLLVLYSVISVLSIVKVRHRNLVPLIPLHPLRNLFQKIPFFLLLYHLTLTPDMLVWCPEYGVTFMAEDIIH